MYEVIEPQEQALKFKSFTAFLEHASAHTICLVKCPLHRGNVWVDFKGQALLFTCFTGTKVQILTHEKLGGRRRGCRRWRAYKTATGRRSSKRAMLY